MNRIIEKPEGFYASVNGHLYGAWRSKGEAQAGMAMEQQRARKREATPIGQAWRTARILHNLPDSPAMREAFYLGARHAMTAMLDAGDDDGQMHQLNDGLHAFGLAAMVTSDVAVSER